jgi:hypothetical protein
VFRFLLSAFAALLAARVVFGLIQAIASGLREGSHETSAGGRRAQEPPAKGPVIDRSQAIDVPYTEVGNDEPAGAGRERRAG